MNGLEAVRVHKPSDNRVAIIGIEFDAVASSSRSLSGDQRCPASSEGVEDDTSSLRAIQNGVGDHRKRFHGGMHRELGIAIATEAARACIIPDIGAVTTEASQLNIVLMCDFVPFLNTKTSSCCDR